MKFAGAEEDTAVSGSNFYDAGLTNYDATTGRALNPAASGMTAGGLSSYAASQPTVLATAAPQTSAQVSINRDAVAAYAEKYADPPHNPNYFYYNGGGAEGDCTNFVSQALYAGGWQQTSEWNYKKPSCLLGIFCSGPTHSWTVVHDFLEFAIRQGRAVFAPWSAAMKGDVIAAWWHPNDYQAGHLLIIDAVKGAPAEKTSGSIWISQHSHDRLNIRLWGPAQPPPVSSRELALNYFKVEPTYKLLHIR